MGTDTKTLFASKTAWFSSAGTVTTIYAILPGILALEPVAIGQLVLILGTWIGTLWARKVANARIG